MAFIFSSTILTLFKTCIEVASNETKRNNFRPLTKFNWLNNFQVSMSIGMSRDL